jgi:hypothetical protein
MTSVGKMFVLGETDFELLMNFNASEDVDFKAYSNGYLLFFHCYAAFVLSKLMLEEKGTFFCIHFNWVSQFHLRYYC